MGCRNVSNRFYIRGKSYFYLKFLSENPQLAM